MNTIKTKETNVEDIISLIKNITPQDKELIKKAYDFAKKAHEGQFRDSGDPYFTHVFETAKILAEIHMGPRVVSAGLLHDVIEDTGVTNEEIKKEFGEKILFLIEGVTKLGKLKYRGLKRHTESLRKFFIATSQDVRVLVIRLADRLHNMETLSYLSREKQIRKSTEVLEIFAPLAYRLGMRILNRRLEDLAFSYLEPEEYKKTVEILKQRKKRDMRFLEKFDRSLKKALAKEGVRDFTTSFRVKGIYSFYKKLERKDNIEKIYDITALRVITKSVADCYKVLGIIHSIWNPLPGRLKDYIALPKPNGYQSIHTTIFTGDGGIVEIQIRTQEMHEMAEMGVASHLSYKGNKSKDVLSQIAWIRDLLIKKDFQQEQDKNKAPSETSPEWIRTLGDECTKNKKKDESFIEDLKTDFFEYRVFVFTPNGDVIDLPSDSSPIDFAYAIHGDIGNHISGAKINGKLASLDTPLKNGDIVEIITKRSSKPTRKWLAMIKTSEARRSIKIALKNPEL
ncbi:HD domain-containing protein [Patescibacteria group bacterium]|nr:HD domain-containing protein [Patescibacteria group bacterium]MCG2694480.1 HD domain-containing protein [Candidatus Parcubacteria bacterium]